MPVVKTTRKAGSTTAKKNAKPAQKKAKKVTLDDVWATMRELQELHKETQAAHRETEKAIKETQAAHRETEKTLNEVQRELGKMGENVGGLNRSMGDLVEILIAAHLWEKFPEYDLQRAYRRIPIYDEKNIAKAEVDILLVNTGWAMAVEVKRQADAEDVKEHIERMERILKYPPGLLPAGVKLLGALAGGIVTPEGREAAHRAGFFVLELTGESVTRVPEPAEFKPKEW
jgi:chromosome segregation ATPase